MGISHITDQYTAKSGFSVLYKFRVDAISLDYLSLQF